MGQRQSPIDIVTSQAVYDSDLGALNTKYNPESKLCLKNNGHSIMCQIKSTSDISAYTNNSTLLSELTGGPLKGDTYRLEQFHLHWGSDDTKGSEHTIDGKKYAAELHLVHWNASKYKSFGESADKSDGLAVLGIMIEVGTENQSFKSITDNIGKVTSSDTEDQIDTSFDPKSLLPGNTSKYWTYEGSLTTPPLYESVQWIVFEDSVQYSADQMKTLRSLKDSDGNCMQDNYRPPVPVPAKESQRKVRASFK
ncbi:carbonic anhydrase 2-like isoform X2 [Mercenaria mercenaria]|uniref:carbonic anhydrase 2-like isoform X2 n=1 Tax=Mercenaria mercenaria TaxID=6596 RepID=UPI00234E5618|nr:carbonic anhydrase 2-like isoform X2 [Mercenaria mercenaria]